MDSHSCADRPWDSAGGARVYEKAAISVRSRLLARRALWPSQSVPQGLPAIMWAAAMPADGQPRLR